MILTLAFVLACSSDPAPAAVSEPKPPAPAAAAPSLTPGELKAAANRVLAPSPVETRGTIERAGITLEIASLVPKRSLSLDAPNKDLVALRTGVLMADTVLTLKETPDADVLARMQKVHEGLTRMGAGQGLLSTLQGLIDRQKNGGMDKAELLTSLDDLVGMAVPEEGVGPDDRTGPLLQSGAWLATTNVAAEAVLRTGKFEAAPALFHQKPVVDWFLGYVRGAGKAKADERVLAMLEQTLVTLGDIAGKDTFTQADVTTIRDRTGELLMLL